MKTNTIHNAKIALLAGLIYAIGAVIHAHAANPVGGGSDVPLLPPWGLAALTFLLAGLGAFASSKVQTRFIGE